jgi:MFS transporter, DHA1 family, tetracycline resistance protein
MVYIHGHKKILLLSQFGTLLSWIIVLLALYLPIGTLFKVDSKIFGAFAFTSPIAILFFARALDGLTGGNVSVANVYLADINVEKDRNLNFGKMAISENLGFIVGPALAGILSVTEYGDAAPVFGAIILSSIGTLLVVFYIQKNKECYLKEPKSTGKWGKSMAT